MDVNSESKDNSLNTGIVLLLVLGIVCIFFYLNLSNKKQDEQNNKNNESQQQIEDNPTVDEPIVEDEPVVEEPSINEPVKEETEPEVKPTTPVNTELKCTKTVNNEYGKFVYTNKYKFKNKSMDIATLSIKVTLNKSYKEYRNSLIQSFKEENKQFVRLDGISESVSKTSNGFTYTLKLDADKLSKKELADMGYRTLNYSGVRIAAYDQGYKCGS